uniref:Tetratricopeptide repeat protein n=1 Tax=Desulfovibrio sp. U5L TaxID=596152 RepID=I2Q369_9BACT
MGTLSRFAPLALALTLALPALPALADPTLDYRDGVAAATKGDMDTAMAAFTRIIDAGAAIEPKNLASAYNLRGMCHDAKNETEAAIADYSKAVETDPKLAEAFGNRAMAYMKLGQVDKAKADATSAKRIDRKVKVPTFE